MSGAPLGDGGTKSFSSDDRDTVVGPLGQLVHREGLQHSERLARAWYTVGNSVWCLVGNGLSNQTFVRGPEGIIAIDSGESLQEMRLALAELRRHTSEPIVAALYTHFHYVQGTTAIVEDRERMGITAPLAVYGHERIAHNLSRAGTAIAPTYTRGLVEQFALALPNDGPDGVVNVGLGLAYRNAEHAPFTLAHLPVTHPFSSATTLKIAGLDIHVQPAPSDADDSVTFWFPSLRVAVNNLVWPLLFNIFAIRGEEYRDPRVLVTGLDHLRGLCADHLVGTHGPPISGADDVARRVTKYRDAIQFLWDQTVRHTNAGATSVELAHAIRLPAEYENDYLTTQFYGVVEHHVRQIRSGLFGWFDGDPVNLFPLARADRANRLVHAMGGVATVRTQCAAATEADPRWALELASLLVARDDASNDDQQLLAGVLRVIARRTTAANIRNWCLTRAREADGSFDARRLHAHRWSQRQVESWGLVATLDVLRVTLVPERAIGVDVHVAFVVTRTNGTVSAGLHVRNFIACPTDGTGATVEARLSSEAWNALLGGATTLDETLASSSVEVIGDERELRQALGVFDHPSLTR